MTTTTTTTTTKVSPCCSLGQENPKPQKASNNRWHGQDDCYCCCSKTALLARFFLLRRYYEGSFLRCARFASILSTQRARSHCRCHRCCSCLLWCALAWAFLGLVSPTGSALWGLTAVGASVSFRSCQLHCHCRSCCCCCGGGGGGLPSAAANWSS